MPLEPCMCGALDCRFCGPLQGSRRCIIHKQLYCDECETYAEKNDGELPINSDELLEEEANSD